MTVSLTTCPDCGTPLSGEAVACPRCGRVLGRRPAAAIVGAIALGFAALGAVAALVASRGHLPLEGASNRRAVHSGQKEQVAFFYDLRANCEVEGYPQIIVVNGPTDGSVSVERGTAYPRYTRENIRFECDRNPAGASLVFYQSRASFHGRDSFTISVRFPDSAVWTESYAVEVL